MLTQYYVLISTIVFILATSIWTTRNWLNVVIKVVLLCLSITGSYLTFKMYGF